MGFMDQLDEEYAPGWKPEPGDTVQGILLSRSTRETKFGTYPILTMLRISGNPEALTTERIAVHATGTALAGWVEEEDPQPGDRLGFRYNGKKPTKDGSNTYHDYSKTRQPAGLVPAELRIEGLARPAEAAPSSPAPAAAAPAHGQPAQAQGEPW